LLKIYFILKAVQKVPKIIVLAKIEIPTGPVKAKEGIRKAKPNLVAFKAPLVKMGPIKFL
jgi:hypothetical protein